MYAESSCMGLNLVISLTCYTIPMITTILSDFSFVILFPMDRNYKGVLNQSHKELIKKYGEDYSFFQYFSINKELLDLFKSIGKSIYIFTSDKIQDRKGVRMILDPIVTKIISAKDYALDKANSEAYTVVAGKISKKTNEILYIDDKELNITAARMSGMNVIQYGLFDEFKKRLEEEFE